MTGIVAQGVTLKLSAPGSPTNLLAVAHLTGFGLQVSAPEIDMTDLDSSAAQVNVGVPKYSFSGEFNLDPDNARHQELRDAIKNRTKVEAQITLTDSTPATCTFEGYVTSWEVRGGVNEKVSGSCAIAVNGHFVWA
jgi:TP901-1 family phage major tail protein